MKKTNYYFYVFWIKLIFLFFGLFFISAIFLNHWVYVIEVINSVNVDLFLLSVVCLLIANILVSFIFFILLKRNGYSAISLFGIVSLSLSAQIAKYLPGKIWAILYQTMKINVDGGIKYIFLSNIDLTVFTISSSLFLSISMILYQRVNIFFIVMVFLVAPLISLYMTFIFSYIFVRTPFIKLYFNTVTFLDRCFNCSFWSLICCYSFFVFNFFSFIIFIISVFDFNFYFAVELSGLLIFTWVLSSLVIFFPAGIGIREYSFILIGSNIYNSIPVEQLSTIALTVRLWQVFTDLFGFFVIILIEYLMNLRRKISDF